MTPEPSTSSVASSSTHVAAILSPGQAWTILIFCASISLCIMACAYYRAYYRKKETNLFYYWVAVIALFGGAIAFFLPIAIDSGFAKDDDGSRLRQSLLYTVGGLLGVITLGETHRKNNQEKQKNKQDKKKNTKDHIRQVHAERRSRYTKAIEQLADEKAAIRLGGIYTLVGLVDEWLADKSIKDEDDRRKEGQVIINNLCSYIRSPFPLAKKIEEHKAQKSITEFNLKNLKNANNKISNRHDNLAKKIKNLTKTIRMSAYKGDFVTDQAKLQEEQDVRRTIFIEINKRVSTFAPKDELEWDIEPRRWSRFSFIFNKAPIFYPLNDLIFENPDFTGAFFYGIANFEEAKFIGTAKFEEAKFTGTANFEKAKFTGTANFKETKFRGTSNFQQVHFFEKVFFEHTIFGKSVIFNKAIFENRSFFVNSKFKNRTEFLGTFFKNIVDFTGGIFTIKSPIFFSLIAEENQMAHFSAITDIGEQTFKISSTAKSKISLGPAELDGKKFMIPVGSVLFNPRSWDNNAQKYTSISEPAKPIEESDNQGETPSK